MKVGLIITGTVASKDTYRQFLEAEKDGKLTLGAVYTLSSKSSLLNASYLKVLIKRRKFGALCLISVSKILLKFENFFASLCYENSSFSFPKVRQMNDSRLVTIRTFSEEYFEMHDDLDLVVVHSSRYISKSILQKFNCPVIGAHPGPVSCYRGSHSSIHAIANGDFKLGYSVFTLSSVIDGGSLHCEDLIDHIPLLSFIALNRYLSYCSYKKIIELIVNGYDFKSAKKGNDNLGPIYEYPGPIIVIKALIKKWLLR